MQPYPVHHCTECGLETLGEAILDEHDCIDTPRYKMVKVYQKCHPGGTAYIHYSDSELRKSLSDHYDVLERFLTARGDEDFEKRAQIKETLEMILEVI